MNKVKQSMITRIPLAYHSTAVAAGRADNHRPVSRRRFATFLRAMLVAGFAIGFSPAALADSPVADHVWGDCELTPDAVKGLIDSLHGDVEVKVPGVPFPQVDFVLVYTLKNDNDGQGLGTEGGAPFTGPILCKNPGTVNIETTEENTPIPDPDSGTVDIKALEQALIMQYQQGKGEFRKRICHTVAGNADCFLITPAP